mmetsp:Transcript_44528/g.69659  ORF Transcript_44528/g.69659 Transcript_44528/m.69659 type:complete len:350 (-) Transcript_44528:49-1098(-)
MMFDTKGCNDLKVDYEHVDSVSVRSNFLSLTLRSQSDETSIEPSVGSMALRLRAASSEALQGDSEKPGILSHRNRFRRSERYASSPVSGKSKDDSPTRSKDKSPSRRRDSKQNKDLSSPRSPNIKPKLQSSEDETQLLKLTFQFKSSYRCKHFAECIEKRIQQARQQLEAPNRAMAFTTSGRVRAGYDQFGYVLPRDEKYLMEKDFMSLLEMTSTVCRFTKGETMHPIGSTERKLFHVLEGEVHAVDLDGDIMVKYQEGEIFGEISFLDSSNLGARYDFVAYSSVQCRVIEEGALHMLLLQPYFAARFFRGLTLLGTIRYSCSVNNLEVRTERMRKRSTGHSLSSMASK